MKQQYSTPVLSTNADVVRATLKSKLVSEDGTHLPSVGGDVGFYL